LDEVFVNFFGSLRKPPDEIVNLPVKIGSSGGSCFQVPFAITKTLLQFPEEG
jgi:hypothetical protein